MVSWGWQPPLPVSVSGTMSLWLQMCPQSVGKLGQEIEPGRDLVPTSGLSDLGQVTSRLWASGCLLFAVGIILLPHLRNRNVGIGGGGGGEIPFANCRPPCRHMGRLCCGPHTADQRRAQWRDCWIAKAKKTGSG